MASSEERQHGTTQAHDELQEPRPTWSSGVIPGLAGGFVMALVLMALSVTQRPGPLAPFPLIASIVISPAKATGVLGVFAGLGIHTMCSAVLGAIFAVLWFTAVRLGETIDRDRAAAEEATGDA